MGKEIANFSSKINKVGVRELAPLPSRSPLFATNCDGTACAACCEEYSDAAFASRIARAADVRLTRDRWCRLSAEIWWWGGNLWANLYGPNDGSWLAKICAKFCSAKNRRANLASLRGEFAPYKILHKKELYGRFLDRRLRVQNLMKNLSSFLPTGLNRSISISLTFGRQCGNHTIIGRLQISTRFPVPRKCNAGLTRTGQWRNHWFITQGNHVPSSHRQIVTTFCARSEMRKGIFGPKRDCKKAVITAERNCNGEKEL